MADWVEPGGKAPDFTLPADDGGEVKLSALGPWCSTSIPATTPPAARAKPAPFATAGRN